MSNFQNPTVPPTGGSRLPHVHPSSFAMCQAVPATLISPEVPEPLGRKLGVPNGVLDVLVPEVVLQAARIDALVGQL